MKSEAIELFNKDGKAVGVFCCSRCRLVFGDKRIAESCCGDRFCDCGNKIEERYYTVCTKCRKVADAKREREKFEKAEKVTEWDGFVWDGSDYYPDIGELIERYSDDERPLPEYVWTCDATAFATLTIDRVKDWINDGGDAPEDFDADDLDGWRELEAAIEKFNKANAGCLSYWPNEKKALLLTPKKSAKIYESCVIPRKGAL